MVSKNKPFVSIVMPAKNAGDFLLEALQSIQNQTYKDWELIVVDDASTDNTFKILKEFSKGNRKLRVFRNKRKRGVSFSANLAISKAKGIFIARMDADDVMFPTRIEKQVNFLIKNKKSVAVGGQCELIDAKGEKTGEKKFPIDPERVREMIFSNIPLQQPALMINAGRLPKDFVWYDNGTGLAEEMELLFKLFNHGDVCNLSDMVLKYRIHGKNTSLKNPKKTFYQTFKTRIIAISKYKYRPSVKGIFISLAQLVIVSILPNILVYPIYSFVRGLSKVYIPLLQKVKPAYNN